MLCFSLRGCLRIFIPVFFATVVTSLAAETFSKKTDIDFFRDVLSRNLKGFAARSDGRLVAGPALTEFSGPDADILWCLAPTHEANRWLIGTGPDGRIFETTLDPAAAKSTSREIIKLEETHVFSLTRLADGAVLAGTSPKGALCLIRDGKLAARVALPVDSIFDILSLDDKTALVATGNPARVYRVDLAKFSSGGVMVDKITDPKLLEARGITLFGEIRDRNIRRLARLADGRVVAGSAPKGSVYVFPREGGAAVFLQENRDAEVTDFLPQPNGDLYATVVFSGGSGEARITPPAKSKDTKEADPVLLTPPEKFAGRSTLVWFPAEGFPETLTSRSGVAFYRLAKHGDTLIVAGGEQGEFLGYDLNARLSVTFPGSISSQLNSLTPISGAPGKFLILRNNAAGLALLDFNATAAREAETRRIDLGSPGLLGALRFNRLRNLADGQLALEVKTSSGSDEIEGWGPWTPLKPGDSAWSAEALRGRYVKLRLRTTGAGPSFEIDKATLFSLPQNHRPLLQDFRVLSPNFSLVVQPESPRPPVVSLSQLMQADKDEEKPRKSTPLSSQVVPTPGTQVVLWTVSDSDGDNLTATFSVRREGETAWTDIAINTRDSYAQFDTANLPDGVYFTRLVATETEPRPAAERLSATFETDDLIVDHTRPELLECTAKKTADKIVVSVHGRDALSLIEGIEIVFNNGVHENLEQPVDGVRDGRQEKFLFELPLAKATHATSVEVTLYDSAGNGVTKRLTW
ncbi:MAG TPA: hypothetical protein VHO24_19540 [Opitutaceae bacterium]|nr:hypothetical protein [Opitutaceae bacterium]